MLYTEEVSSFSDIVEYLNMSYNIEFP